MAVKPIHHKKIIKKRINKFIRFEQDVYPHRLKLTWRRPRGIDNRVRRRFRGNKPMAKIGYGSDNNTKFLLPSGFKKFLIRNDKELEILLMNNRFYIGEIAQNISAKNRAAIVKRAAELNVRLTNGKAKVKTEEKKVEK